jgi:hypothetical protein
MYPKASFVDVLMPSDIVYMISIIKNSEEMWDQDMRMKDIGKGEMAT